MRLADKPYEAALVEQILQPLELKNTFPYHSRTIEQLAHPIIGETDLHSYPKRGINQVSVGIGNIVSDAADLNAFLRAVFLDKKLLSAPALAAMTDFQAFGENHVGLGAFQETYANRTVRGHTGRTISYICYAFVDVATGTSMVLLCNNANDGYIDLLLEDVAGL